MKKNCNLNNMNCHGKQILLGFCNIVSNFSGTNRSEYAEFSGLNDTKCGVHPKFDLVPISTLIFYQKLLGRTWIIFLRILQIFMHFKKRFFPQRNNNKVSWKTSRIFNSNHFESRLICNIPEQYFLNCWSETN